MEDLVEQCVNRLPNFAGLKFTSFRLDEFGQCLRKFGDKLTLCYGKDEVPREALSAVENVDTAVLYR